MTALSTLKPNVWLEHHPKLGIALMDHLFNRLDGAYPNRWRAAFSSEQAIANWRETWAEAFDEEGLTPQMVADGLRACRKQFDWPPSLTEFLKACKPPLNVDAALYEAIAQMAARQKGKDVWSNPAIFWAAAAVGQWDMLGQSFSQLKPRFERAIEKVLQGDILPVPDRVPALAAPGESTREHARQCLANLGASGILRAAPNGVNIGWAKKILDDHDLNGKVPQHKLRIARQAIENVGMRA